MNISRVYKIVNDIDGLVYIGSTKQILCRRMTEHRKLAFKNWHPCGEIKGFSLKNIDLLCNLVLGPLH